MEYLERPLPNSMGGMMHRGPSYCLLAEPIGNSGEAQCVADGNAIVNLNAGCEFPEDCERRKRYEERFKKSLTSIKLKLLMGKP